MKARNGQSPLPREQGGETRQKLLLASIEVFGRRGFDAASTRMLAEAAGVNLQAIPYYFGDKQGLYHAAAEYIAASIDEDMKATRERVVARCDEAEAFGPPMTEGEARSLLVEVLLALASMVTSRAAEASVQFLMREMTTPTSAFDRIHKVTGPGMRVIDRLLAVILREPSDSEGVRLRTVSLVGALMMFRLSRANVMRHLDWVEIGEREAGLIHDLAVEIAGAVRGPDRSAGGPGDRGRTG